ncbi:MAG: flavin reductase [Pirellulales bacterium]|nr:flavin reductase [Pirellulales bacterium]
MSHDPYPVLGRVTSGIYILTIGQGDRATGMLASWVMQAGFEPPMITVAVRQGRYVAEWLAAGEPFVLNVVSDGQKHWLKHFGKGFEPGEPAFIDLEVHPAANGVPVLSEALGYLECEPTSHLDSGEHRIFLAKVTAGKMQHDASPMVHLRKTGAHY